MATIAIASAQSDGLDIVGDERSGTLHRVLLEQDLDSIYDAWLGNTMPPRPRLPTKSTCSSSSSPQRPISRGSHRKP
jgi:hypothetical protein